MHSSEMSYSSLQRWPGSMGVSIRTVERSRGAGTASRDRDRGAVAWAACESTLLRAGHPKGCG